MALAPKRVFVDICTSEPSLAPSPFSGLEGVPRVHDPAILKDGTRAFGHLQLDRHVVIVQDLIELPSRLHELPRSLREFEVVVQPSLERGAPVHVGQIGVVVPVPLTLEPASCVFLGTDEMVDFVEGTSALDVELSVVFVAPFYRVPAEYSVGFLVAAPESCGGEEGIREAGFAARAGVLQAVEKLVSRWVGQVEQVHVESEVLVGVCHVFGIGYGPDVPGRAVECAAYRADALCHVLNCFLVGIYVRDEDQAIAVQGGHGRLVCFSIRHEISISSQAGSLLEGHLIPVVTLPRYSRIRRGRGQVAKVRL